MAAFFMVQVTIPDPAQRAPYDQYIQLVRPIVERFGGEYLVRSEQVSPFGEGPAPDRVIVIRFADRAALDACFASPDYAAIKGLRELSVQTTACIVEE